MNKTAYITFESPTDHRQRGEQDAGRTRPTAAPTGSSTDVSASLTFLRGPLQGQTLPLDQAVTTIGSDSSNDIVVCDGEVSRHHLRLIKGEAVWRLEKQSQAGAVALNQRQVDVAVLRDRSVVDLGPHTSFVFSLRTIDAPVRERRNPPLPPRAAAHLSAVRSMSTLPGTKRRTVTSNMPATSAARSSARKARPGAPADEKTFIAGRMDSGTSAFMPPSARPYIEVRGERETRTIFLDEPVLDIGRDPANDLVLDDLVVSGRHLRLVREGDRITLMHPHPDRAQTLNGLTYLGRQIRGDESFRTELANGDIIRIGDDEHKLVTLVFHDGVSAAPTLPPVQPIPLIEPVYSIGRRADCKIVLPHPQVSARHAMLVREGGSYRVIDQHSANGIYINGERQTDYLLALGDEIQIGPYRLVYEASHLTQYDESRFIGIQAEDLCATGSNGSVLLNHISINIPPRSFVALVGGSGAGKSTLMDALNGLRPAQSGHVAYNGQDLYMHRAAFSGQMGYVPQDDIVHKNLTVERALHYAAKLRLPSDFTEQQIAQRINEVLDDVEMTPRRHLLVKKLSGGQRKRVSIALELLANPSIFFLDEPTSGLDAGLDRKMMYLLRRLADRGHTVVLVTHATTNIAVCDYICVLAQGGRLAYYGPPAGAKAYFDAADFADIYTSLEPTDDNPNIPAEAEARFQQSRAYQEYVVGPLVAAATQAIRPATAPASAQASSSARRPKRGISRFKQFTLLTHRQLELLRNDRVTLLLFLLQAPLMAVLVIMLIRSSAGPGLFDQNKAVQCAPQIMQSVVAPSGTASASGPVRLGINTGTRGDPNAPVNCEEIHQLLSGDPKSKASAQMIQLAKDYTKAKGHGNVNTALQDFIVTGSGFNALTVLFIMAFLGVLPGCVNGVRQIVKERSIYRRERAINLGILPYVGAKMAFMGMFVIFQSTALLFIVNLFEPFRTSVLLPVLPEIFVTLVLTQLAGLMLGLAVSALAANEDSANGMLPFLLIPQVVFAGVEFQLKELPLQLIGMLDPMRWAVVAMGTSAGLHSDKLGGDALLGHDNTFHGTLFSTFTQSDAVHRLLLGWGALGTLIIVLAIVACIGLKRKDVGRGASKRASRHTPKARFSAHSG